MPPLKEELKTRLYRKRGKYIYKLPIVLDFTSPQVPLDALESLDQDHNFTT